MKICKKCLKEFGFSTTINGKRYNLQNRKYCLDCSPFGKHNTKQIENKENIDCVCKFCNRKYVYNRKIGHTKDTCNSCLVNKSRVKIKEKLIEYKGGKCEKCGYQSGHVKVFDFHHREKKEKEINISGSYCRSFELLKKEVDKCMLLCSNCHRIEHE